MYNLRQYLSHLQASDNVYWKKTNSLPLEDLFFFLLLKQYFKIKFSESLWHSQQIFPFGSVSYSVSRRIPINLSCIKTWYSNEKGLEKSKLWRSYITTLLALQWNKLLKILNCQICKEKQFSASVGSVLCQLKKKNKKRFSPPHIVHSNQCFSKEGISLSCAPQNFIFTLLLPKANLCLNIYHWIPFELSVIQVTGTNYQFNV